MPTRMDVTVSADADSLAGALKPIGHLTSGGVAHLGASGNRTHTAAGLPGFLRAPSPEPGPGGPS